MLQANVQRLALQAWILFSASEKQHFGIFSSSSKSACNLSCSRILSLISRMSCSVFASSCKTAARAVAEFLFGSMKCRIRAWPFATTTRQRADYRRFVKHKKMFSSQQLVCKFEIDLVSSPKTSQPFHFRNSLSSPTTHTTCKQISDGTTILP